LAAIGQPIDERWNRMLTDFEVTYILHPSLQDASAVERANSFADNLRADGGEVVGEIEHLGKRRLAYQINEVREGYYVVMKFRATLEHKKEFERHVRLNEHVLRALFIRTDD
jgi:small subunit ribosomal protein S6